MHRLSRGSTRLHCAKTAERIKIPLRLNIVGDPRNIVLHGVLILHRKADVELQIMLPVMDSLRVSSVAEGRNLKFRVLTERWGP